MEDIHYPQRQADFYKRLPALFSSWRVLMPIVVAIFIGTSTGFLAVGFIKAVGFCEHLFFGDGQRILRGLGKYYVVLIPVIGGFFVGPLITYFAPEAKGHGVPQVLKAIALNGGRIRPVVVVIKGLASILSLGTGFSVGREGPIVQIGSALGSSVAQVLKLHRTQVKNFIACGAAAGIAAVFNAPIAGVMFASEVILKDFALSALSPVVIAAVSASVVSRMFLGDHPAFVVPSYQLQSPWEIFIYLILGILSGVAAIVFMHVLHKNEDFWDGLKLPAWFKPVLGGLVLGVIGLFFPQVFGAGFGTIENVLNGNLPVFLLLALVVMKILATSVSLGAGSSGGVFAPLLFIGAVLGGSVGQMVGHKFAFPVEVSGAYALVGMACVFSAAAHAPVTAMLIVFEMTNGYHLILPIMSAVIAATFVSRYFQKESIYTMKLKQKGIDISSFEEVKSLGGLQVRDAMTDAFDVVSSDLPVRDLVSRIFAAPERVVFTKDRKGTVTGVIEYEEIQHFLLEDNVQFLLAEDMASPIRGQCLDDDPLVEAARDMTTGHVTHIPVFDHHDTERLIGVLRSEDVLRRYSFEASRRTAMIEQAEDEGVAAQGLIIVPFAVAVGSGLVGKKVRDLGLPQGIHFTSIRRKKKVIVPLGDTILISKDRVLATMDPEQRPAFDAWLQEQ